MKNTLPAICCMILASLFIQCRTRRFDVAHSSNAEHDGSSVKHDTRGSCSVPTPTDFLAQSQNPVQQQILKATALAIAPILKDAPLTNRLTGPVLGDWIVKTVAPLNMNCDVYKTTGLNTYGADAFIRFAQLVATVYAQTAPYKFTPAPKNSVFDIRKTNNPEHFPLLGILRTINSKITSPETKTFTQFRSSGEDSMHSIPLRTDELTAMQQIAPEGILSVVAYQTPFKNAYGEMVSGQFLKYPNGAQVDSLLQKMEQEFGAAPASSNYELAVAKLVRQCISIHPFHDANGRSCLILGAWALAQKGIPHAVIWAGEDVLLSAVEWNKRFVDGVTYHKNMMH